MGFAKIRVKGKRNKSFSKCKKRNGEAVNNFFIHSFATLEKNYYFCNEITRTNNNDNHNYNNE